MACPAGVSAAGGYFCAVPSKLPDPSESSRSQPPDKSGTVADAAGVARCVVACGALQPVAHTAKSNAPLASRRATRARNLRRLTIELMTSDYRQRSTHRQEQHRLSSNAASQTCSAEVESGTIV